MSEQERTYFEFLGNNLKNLVSKFLPGASLKTKLLIVMIGLIFLFASTLSLEQNIHLIRRFQSMLYMPELFRMYVYHSIVDVLLIIGSLAMLFGKRVGWYILTSFVFLRMLPRLDHLINQYYWTDRRATGLEVLFGYGFPEVVFVLSVLLLFLVLLYSRNVTSLYNVRRKMKLIPFVSALLFGNVWVLINNLV